MSYLYENHMGGLYTSDYYIDPDELYCEQCGDSDWLLGEYETLNEFWNLIESECDINGSGGYFLQYVYPIMVSEFELPDQLEYDDYDDQLRGFCNTNDDDIINRIEELIGRKVVSVYEGEVDY